MTSRPPSSRSPRSPPPSSRPASSPARTRPEVDPLSDALVRLRLDVSYDGTGFHGWASQPGLRTVQRELEAALGRVLRQPAGLPVSVAGRTDAGVHARGQVCHVDVPREALAALTAGSGRSGGASVVRRLAGLLPDDLRVRSAEPAPAGFDARFSALWRRYAYRVADAPWGVDPLRRHDVARHARALDLAALRAAATGLLGEHDFAAFCRPRPGATTIRTLLDLSWRRADDGIVVSDVRADAFCHSMVRALVGALLAVGDGRRDPQWPARVLAAGVRDGAVTVVPAHGLTLEEVGYPAADQLAARAREARSVRTLPSPG